MRYDSLVDGEYVELSVIGRTVRGRLADDTVLMLEFPDQASATRWAMQRTVYKCYDGLSWQFTDIDGDPLRVECQLRWFDGSIYVDRYIEQNDGSVTDYDTVRYGSIDSALQGVEDFGCVLK